MNARAMARSSASAPLAMRTPRRKYAWLGYTGGTAELPSLGGYSHGTLKNLSLATLPRACERWPSRTCRAQR